jgi:hypothetical protein
MTGAKVTQADYPLVETTNFDEEMMAVIQDENFDYEDVCNDQFRIVPNDELLRPFLAAFANETKGMQRLSEAALWCPFSGTRTIWAQ